MNPVSSAKKGGFIGVDTATNTNKDQQAPLLIYQYDEHSLQIEETTIVHDTVTAHVREEITASTLKEGSVTIQHVVHCQQKDTTPILIIICCTGEKHDHAAFWYNLSTRQMKEIELPSDITSRITSVSITATPSRMSKLPTINKDEKDKQPEKEHMSHVIVFTLDNGSTCIGILTLYPDEIMFETHKYIDASLVDDAKVTASAIIVGTMKSVRTAYNRPRVLLGTNHGKVITFRVSKLENGDMELLRSDYTRFMKLDPLPIVLLSSLRAGSQITIAVAQNAVRSKGNSTYSTKQGVINVLSTFGNGRKSGFRVRPSLTRHLCDLDVLRLTHGHDKDFRITAAFHEQAYKKDLEFIGIYVGHGLTTSKFEFKVKEPQRSGVMDLFQIGSGCIAMMAGQDDDRLHIVNSIPDLNQQTDTQHYLYDSTSTSKERDHENMASPKREETPEIKNDRSDLSFTESEAASPHSIISRDGNSDIDGYGYSPEKINSSRRSPIIRRHEDTTDTQDMDHHVLEEEDSFEEKLTVARARRQPLVVRHIDTGAQSDRSEQNSPMSSPERVPEFQDTAYSFLHDMQHVQQKVEYDQEQQSAQNEDKCEFNHVQQNIQQEDTIRIDVDHEQQNGTAAPLTEMDNLVPTPPPRISDPKQLQALVEEIGIVMNEQQQRNMTTNVNVPSESVQPREATQDTNSEEAYAVIEEKQNTQSRYHDLNTLDEQDNNPLITPDSIPSSPTRSMNTSGEHDKGASQDLDISQELQILTQEESHDENGIVDKDATPSALDSIDANVGIPEPLSAEETLVYTQEETTTIQGEKDTMDNSDYLDDMGDYNNDDEQFQALAGENSSFAGFLPLANDTTIENNIKLLSDALENHMTQHIESTVPTSVVDASQTNGSLNDTQHVLKQTAPQEAFSDNGVSRNPSIDQFVDKLNQWRPHAVNETLFIDLLFKESDSQYVVNDTYLRENAPDLLHKLIQGDIQDSQCHRQALYYLYLEHVDCGVTLASLDKVSDQERNKIQVYHMLDQGLYKEAMKHISEPTWMDDAWQYKILKTLEKHCDIISFVQTTGIAERSLGDTMAYIELLWDMSLADALEYMGSMQNTDWQHHCLDSILDRVFQDDVTFHAQDPQVLGTFNYTKDGCQQFVKHAKESSSPIAKLALMYYYESQKEWIDALKVMRELEVMPAHVKKHPAYDACLTVERSVRQSMPDILRHLPEEIMLYPRGQATGEYKDFFKTYGNDAGYRLFAMALQNRMLERKRKAEQDSKEFPNKR